MRSVRWMGGVLALGVLGLSSATFASNSDSLGIVRAGDPLGPQVGADAYSLRLKSFNEEAANKLVNSEEVALHDFVGVAPAHPRKAVVLHFSSMAHERSVKDFEALQKMYRRYADDGLMILDVNIDSDSSEKVFEVLEDERVGFPVLRDRFGVVARRYGLRHLPTVYVIDADGKVVSVREGYTDDVSEFVEAEVKELLRK